MLGESGRGWCVPAREFESRLEHFLENREDLERCRECLLGQVETLDFEVASRAREAGEFLAELLAGRTEPTVETVGEEKDSWKG